MPNQPETVDRIQIIAEAPSLEAVGAALAALTKLGFQNVGYKLITDVLQYKHNQPNEAKRVKKQRPPKRISNADLVTQTIKDWNEFTVGELHRIFKEAGRNPASVSPILWKLGQARLVERLGSGQYKRTTKGLNGAADG